MGAEKGGVRIMNEIKYTFEDKERVYALYATGMAGREIARQLDIPQTTVVRWIKETRTSGEPCEPQTVVNQDGSKKTIDLEAMRTAKKVEFINSAWALITKSLQLADKRITRALEKEAELDALIDEIGAEDMNDKQKSALISKLRELQIQGVRELSTLIGTMYDKAALASGDSTSKVDVSGSLTAADKELLKTVGDRLASDS